MRRPLNTLYRAAALLFFNTFLVLVIALAALHFLVPPLSRGPRYSDEFDLDSYSRISREEALAVGREFDLMGEEFSYEFVPWTQFRERPFKGRWVNVLENGTRKTTEPDPDFADREPLRVWAFGGSTMFGWGVPDSETIASHLQALLQARTPEHQVQVSNFGHSYYFSSMELAYFLALFRQARKNKPDVVVFLDGLNDAAFLMKGFDVPYFSGALYHAWEREREEQMGMVGDLPWITLNGSFPVFRLAERLGDTALRAPEGPRRFRKRPPNRTAFLVRHFDTNRRALLALGSELGVETYQFLQPVRAFETPPPEGMPAGLAEAYPVLLAESRLGLHPIHDVLQNEARAYVDYGHYSDQGCYLVAAAMAEVIAP